MVHVLIVEDVPDVLLLLETRMLGASHEVESVTDGEQALAAVAQREPSVIVLDWMMPKLDGLGVCERIRRTDTERRLRVLVLPAKSQLNDIDRAYASVADGHIVKPFSSRDLIDRVAALIGD